MAEQTLEQEFTARIWSDLFTEWFMLEPFSVVGGAIVGSFLDGAAKEAGKLAVDNFTIDKIRPVFGKSSPTAFLRIQQFRAIFFKRFKNIDIFEKVVEDPRNNRLLLKAALEAGEVKDEHALDLLAVLVADVLNRDSDDSELADAAIDACSVIHRLKIDQLKYLGLYTILGSIIPAEFGDLDGLSDEEFSSISQAVAIRIDELVSLSLLSGLSIMSTKRYDSMLSKFCLKFNGDISFPRRPKEFLLRTPLPFLEDRGSSPFWKDHASLFFSDNGKPTLLRNYSPTGVGYLIGYLVLEYFADYDGPFYGFE